MEHKGVILLVEDNAALCDSNSRALRMCGYEVMTALTLGEAHERLTKKEPDIILLDVMLPDGDGFSFCRKIREHTTAHILFLTAKTGQEDIIRGLADGGDDYIVKPFRLQELLARIDASMRRRRIDRASMQRIKKGALTLDIVACQAYIEEKDLMLSQKEFAILLLLIQNEGETMSAEYVYKSVWGRPMESDTSALHTAVYRLRKKLEHTGYDIVSTRRKGYTFEEI